MLGVTSLPFGCASHGLLYVRNVVGMNSIEEHLDCGLDLWIAPIDAVSFLRPGKFSLGKITAKAARVTEPLPFHQIRFPPPELLSQCFLVGNIYPCPVERPAVSRRNAHATDATNLSLRPHNPFREVESATFCKHLLNGFRDELPIFRVYQPHIFFYGWSLTAWIKPINPEQLWRPVVEASRVEGPTTHMRQALSFREIELGLFALGKIDDKRHAPLAFHVERSRADQHRHPAAILAEKLFLKRLQSPGQLEL